MTYHENNTVIENLYANRIGLVYARVSSKKQETEGSGLDSQEERCARYLQSIGVLHEKTYPDTYSGGGDFMDRPGMKRLLADIDARPHKKFLVVFDDLKRFARDTTFHLKLRAAFKSRDVLLQCLNYNFEDNPEGKFAETVFAAHGQLEREQNQRQVVQKMKARLEAGYWSFVAKKGYSFNKESLHGKILRPNPESDVLIEALEGFANRTFVRKIDVCRFLVEKDFWKGQSPDKYIYRLSKILVDPFYAGYIEYHDWEVERRKGQHEGIITLDTFERIQKILRKENSVSRIRQDISPDFPLRGLVVCDHCGGHLTAAWTRRIFPYYLCHNKSCDHYGKSIPRETIETRFLTLLRKNSLKSDVAELAELVFDRIWEGELNAIKEHQAVENHKRAYMESKAQKITDLILGARSDNTKKVYEIQLEKIAQELAFVTEPLAAIDLSIPYRTALTKTTELLRNPYSIWKSMSVFEQHRLFYFIFDEKLPYNHLTGYRTDKVPCMISLFEEFAIENNYDVDLGRIELPT